MRSNTQRMTSRHGGTSFKFLLMISFLVTGVATLHFEPAYAEQTVTAKVKVTHRGISGHALPAPDEKGHVLAVGQREGEVDFDGKESAKYESTSMLDGWIGKKGIYKGYTKYTFKDGSKIFFSWTAEGGRNKAGLPMQQGRGIIKRGTGRFEGIRGQAVFTANQLKPSSEDRTRASVTDAVIVYTLP